MPSVAWKTEQVARTMVNTIGEHVISKRMLEASTSKDPALVGIAREVCRR